MDVNIALLKGRLAVPPMVEQADDGSPLARLLILVRSERRFRIDVLPVVVSGSPATVVDRALTAGTSVYVSGALMRRCSPGVPGRVEVVADSVEFPDSDGHRKAR